MSAMYFICLRRSDTPSPRPAAYPVVRLEDGSVRETTWAEYRAHLADQQKINA